MEKEISKEEFKRLYFKYGSQEGVWTKVYWDHFFEHEKGKRYFFTPPDSLEQTRMFISSDSSSHRIFLLSEEAEESFFEFPEYD